MKAGHALLASALFLILILQSSTSVDASAAAGEWTGTIEGDFTGLDDGAFGDFRRHAEFTFTIAQDLSISGSGTGWERYASPSGCTRGSADNVTFKISGYVDLATGKALLTFEQVTPDEYPTVDCTGYQDSYTMHPFRVWQSFFEIELTDGASIDSGAGTRRPGSDYPLPSGIDVLVIHGSGTFDFEISVEPQVVNVVQGDTPSWNLIVTLISGIPKPVTVDFFWLNVGGTKDLANSYDITPTGTIQISADWGACDLSPGSYIGRYEATNGRGEIKTAQFTLNVIESAGCKALADSDGDGIADSTDQCPEQSETVNGYLDTDGCPDNPDTDTDGDGIVDAEDQCQINAETVDGTDDADGCPEITNVSIQGPVLTGDGMLTLNTDDPDGWHTRWETGDGTIKYDTCTIGGGNGWCVSQQLYPNSVFQAKQCTPGSNGAYGYCTVAGNERTTSTDVWLVTGQMHVASNVKPIQPVTSTGGYSVDTGIVISYGEYTAALKGTEVIAEVDDDGTSTLTVLEGEVYVWKTDRPDETVRVVAGQQLATHPEEFLPGPTSADSFIKSVETLKARDPTLVFPAGNTLSDDEFIFYGAIAIIIFFVIIAAVVIGIYFGVKKIRNRKKQKLV